jgi:hypothetical protein
MSGTLVLGDDVKATFGAGSDLQIYHNGSDSYIDDTGTGGLILRGNAAVTIGKYTGETMGYFEADGAVSLYHNNAIKMATSASGISVTGNVAVTGTVDGVDLQTLNTAVTANTAKTTNATHSGEVTGSGALTIADNVVDEANLKVSNSAVNGYFLSAQSGNAGGLTWAEAGGGGSRTLLQTVTASSDATVLIGSSSLLSSTYKRYEILVENVVATTTIIGRVRIGGAVKTANYMFGFLDMSSRFGLSETQSGAETKTSITLMNSSSFPSGASYNSTITLFDPANTNLTKQIICSGINLTSITGFDVGQCLTYAAYKDGTAAVDGFQFSTASGSIVSGTFKLYGIT